MRGALRPITVCLGAAALAALALALARPARGHEPPSRVETREGQRYRLEIAIYDEQPYVRRPVRFSVHPLAGGALLSCETLTALGRPFVETHAIPTRATRLRPDPDAPTWCAGEVLLPVQGLWDLEIHVAAVGGREVARVPITVAAPHAIPKWIAWVIGLSPLGAMGMFAWWQRGYLRQLRMEEP